MAELLLRHYGLQGEITALSSEAEFTAQVITWDGRSLILKLSARAEARDSFCFQATSIAALQDSYTFTVPTIIRTIDGGLTFEEADFSGYLQTKLLGRQLHSLGANPDAYYQTGRALAHLNLALRPLDVPGKYRPILWHIGCWSHLTQLQQYLPTGAISEHVRSSMSDFSKIVEPQLAMVEWQITHNDPSPHNVFFLDREVAFIDFGDGTFGPRIQDLAIAASHLVTDTNRALGGAEDLIAGYASVFALSTLETNLLVPLMRARQSALILVNHWRAHLFPADADYIKKNVSRAERGLSILAALAPAEAEASVLDCIRRSR
ncbi:phosphotransferase [Rhizobium sp. NZLR11]|nr:phosphotransferase [Rhizobium sp. NZLR11]